MLVYIYMYTPSCTSYSYSLKSLLKNPKKIQLVMALASLFSLLTIVALTSSTIDANNNDNTYGLSIDLMHRDSPNSPFYNPSETHSQRVRNAIRRSFNRVNHFNDPTSSSSPNTASAEVISADGEYLMNISIGTPPFQVLAIADTGSDLIWTQCKPCTHCYKQQSPLFDPIDSSTYRELPCSSSTCLKTGGGSCGQLGDHDNMSCQYTVSYGDQSYSNGVIAADTLTLGSTSTRPVSIPKTIFGCGTNNDGTFNGEGSGIIGLGGGSASLISQMGSTIGGKFSYCLVPFSDSSSSNSSSNSSSSKMNFGSKGVVSGEGVISTGLVQKSPKTFYFLTLEGISVGTERINLYNSFNSSTEGNIIIDSGTTLTLLPQEFYQRVEAAVIRQVKGQRVDDPQQFLSLCYQTQTDVDSPVMTVHFAGGDLKLNSYNTFIRVSEGVVCFAFAPVESLAIFGNLAQMNFLVGYDVEEMTVSFKPADCTQ